MPVWPCRFRIFNSRREKFGLWFLASVASAIYDAGMPVYVYETIDSAKPKRRFEVQQSMRDEPLKTDPETGKPVRRVISGGYGILQKGTAENSARAPKHSCGSGGCGCH